MFNFKKVKKLNADIENLRRQLMQKDGEIARLRNEVSNHLVTIAKCNKTINEMEDQLRILNIMMAQQPIDAVVKTSPKRRGRKRKETLELSKEEILRQLKRAYPTLNQSKLAESLGVSQPYVNKAINKN